MPLAGMGYGAAKGLEEILAEQMLRAQMAQREQENQQRIALEQQRLNETIRQNDLAETSRAAAVKDRSAANIVGAIDDQFDPGQDQMAPEVSDDMFEQLQGTPQEARIQNVQTLPAKPIDPMMAGTMSQTPELSVRRIAPTGAQAGARRTIQGMRRVGAELAAAPNEAARRAVGAWAMGEGINVSPGLMGQTGEEKTAQELAGEARAEARWTRQNAITSGQQDARQTRSDTLMRERAVAGPQRRPLQVSSVKDLADVAEALTLANQLDFKTGDTGILPSLGGAVPDFVTNLTGFGVEAKSRQGVINLVKQIIGKGLEGGVLRKEDESKYDKILPTLRQHPDVVTAKIANLKNTLQNKREVLLDALADAGYDVSKFVERGAPGGNDADAAAQALIDKALGKPGPG